MTDLSSVVLRRSSVVSPQGISLHRASLADVRSSRCSTEAWGCEARPRMRQQPTSCHRPTACGPLRAVYACSCLWFRPSALAGVGLTPSAANTAPRAPAQACCAPAPSRSNELPLEFAGKPGRRSLQMSCFAIRTLSLSSRMTVASKSLPMASHSGGGCAAGGRRHLGLGLGLSRPTTPRSTSGAALRAARRAKERTYPELLRSARCRHGCRWN